jgi:hypothetical protein
MPGAVDTLSLSITATIYARPPCPPAWVFVVFPAEQGISSRRHDRKSGGSLDIKNIRLFEYGGPRQSRHRSI